MAYGRYIHKYSQSGQYQRVCYTAPEGASLRCITTMKDGRIIAGDDVRSVITLHTSDGMTLIKTINTRIKPYSITAINNTHVAICHGSFNKVYVIDMESGEVTLSIGIGGWPLSVCYDEKTDCLLIARGRHAGQCLLIAHGRHAGQCVIDQYSLSTGDKIACIAQNIDLPYVMIFTGDGMLGVGVYKTVKLYTVGFEG